MASSIKSFTGSNIIEVSEEKAIAAAENYDDEDILSENVSTGTAWNFDEIVRHDGGIGKIVKAIISIETTDLVPALTLYLFNITPTGETDDNKANDNPVLGDKEEYQGRIDWSAMDNSGGISEAQVIFNPPLPFACASADDSLFGILVTNTAFTNEAAGMKCLIKLMVSETIDT